MPGFIFNIPPHLIMRGFRFLCLGYVLLW